MLLSSCEKMNEDCDEGEKYVISIGRCIADDLSKYYTQSEVDEMLIDEWNRGAENDAELLKQIELLENSKILSCYFNIGETTFVSRNIAKIVIDGTTLYHYHFDENGDLITGGYSSMDLTQLDEVVCKLELEEE